MSIARAQRVVLERLGAGSTVLLAVCLELPAVPEWCDGRDAAGRAVLLVGRHQLGDTPEAAQAVAAVGEALAAGAVPDGVHVVAYAARASAAIAEVVAGASEQVLIDGPRGSGKTMLVPAALAGLAEWHARAGDALPLRALWLHDALVSAAMKTGRSLEAEPWAGAWGVRDDRRVAALVVGGREHVLVDFVGALDASGQERARAECHVVVGEELVSSLDESAGVPERVWDTARSSMRLRTRRRVALATTNPGDVTTWPYQRWLEGGGRRGCVRCAVPAEDRLTAAEIAALRATFSGAPDLERRLGRGEWSALKLGVTVAEGYDAAVHVAAAPLTVSPDLVLCAGFDGGHTPSAVLGQLVGGQVRVFASLNAMGSGVLELLEDQVVPWLVTHAPWTRRNPRTLVAIIDPSMRTTSEATIRVSAEKTVRDVLGCRVESKFSNLWPPRREAVLRVVAARHEGGRVPLAISPTPDTAVLRQALAARWYYRQTPDGRVDRSGAKKPNSPWSDVADAFTYMCLWLRPGSRLDGGPARRPEVKSAFDAYTGKPDPAGPTARGGSYRGPWPP